MLTVEGVCNVALSYIGVRNFITDIDEDAMEAIVAKVHVDACINQVLGERWWNFAEASATLARISVTAPSGWSFAYSLPTDMLPAKARFIYAGHRRGMVRANEGIPFAYRWISGQGQTLLTDHEAPELIYTRRVTELVYWPEAAADAIAWLLAPKLALGLNVDLRKGMAFADEYQRRLGVAMAEDMNSMVKGADPELVSSFQAGR